MRDVRAQYQLQVCDEHPLKRLDSSALSGHMSKLFTKLDGVQMTGIFDLA